MLFKSLFFSKVKIKPSYKVNRSLELAKKYKIQNSITYTTFKNQCTLRKATLQLSPLSLSTNPVNTLIAYQWLNFLTFFEILHFYTQVLSLSPKKTNYKYSNRKVLNSPYTKILKLL